MSWDSRHARQSSIPIYRAGFRGECQGQAPGNCAPLAAPAAGDLSSARSASLCPPSSPPNALWQQCTPPSSGRFFVRVHEVFVWVDTPAFGDRLQILRQTPAVGERIARMTAVRPLQLHAPLVIADVSDALAVLVRKFNVRQLREI